LESEALEVNVWAVTTVQNAFRGPVALVVRENVILTEIGEFMACEGRQQAEGRVGDSSADSLETDSRSRMKEFY
jgi:hypothetical protein